MLLRRPTAQTIVRTSPNFYETIDLWHLGSGKNIKVDFNASKLFNLINFTVNNLRCLIRLKTDALFINYYCAHALSLIYIYSSSYAISMTL